MKPEPWEGACIALQPKTFCFTCENSIHLMNGQCLHFVKLNSWLGQSSMGITMAAPVTGTGQQGIRQQRARNPGPGSCHRRARQADNYVAGAPGIGWRGAGKKSRMLVQEKSYAAGRGGTHITYRNPGSGPWYTVTPRKVSRQGTFTPALTFPLLLPQTQENLCAPVISSPALLSMETNSPPASLLLLLSSLTLDRMQCPLWPSWELL